MAFFSYLDGVWEWVQVASHYTLLAHTYAAAKASSPAPAQMSSIVPPTVFPCCYPTFCLIITQGRSHNPSKCLIRNVKVHPGSSDPPCGWKTWEEYLQSKPGEFTPDQIIGSDDTEPNENRQDRGQDS